MPSHLAQGPTATPLRKFLIDLELEARRTISNRRDLLQEGSGANLKSQNKVLARPDSNFGVGAIMLLVFCLSIFLKFNLVHDFETTGLIFMIFIFFYGSAPLFETV